MYPLRCITLSGELLGRLFDGQSLSNLPFGVEFCRKEFACRRLFLSQQGDFLVSNSRSLFFVDPRYARMSNDLHPGGLSESGRMMDSNMLLLADKIRGRASASRLVKREATRDH